MIAEVVGESGFRKFDGDGEDVGVVDQLHPVVAVVGTVASYTVVDEEDRRGGGETNRAGRVQR